MSHDLPPRESLNDLPEPDDDLDDLDELDDDPIPPVVPKLTYGAGIGEKGIERVQWLWEPYLAFGALSVLDGDPGVGKSLLTIDIAARIGAHRDFPDGRRAPSALTNPRHVVATIFVNAEDEVRRTILPRVSAAKGNVLVTLFFGGVGEGGCAVRFPDDLYRFANTLHEFPGAFVVLDPMMALFSRSAAAGNDQAIRELLTPIARIAADTRCCILLVRHLNARQASRALHRGAGSVGILGACRTGLIVERHPDDPDRRVLAMTKSNLGPLGPSHGFRVREEPEHTVERDFPAGAPNPETGKPLQEPQKFRYRIPAQPVIEWEGVSSLTADDLVLAKPDATGPGLRAAAWLKKVLANGPVAAKEIEKLAAMEGFGYRTVQVAKGRLKVESQRAVVDGQPRWTWMLPPDPSD